MRARVIAVAAAVVATAAVTGCGKSGPAPKALAPVRLRLDAPADLVRMDADTVEVRGRVWPADATVLVQGRSADVTGGIFSATVRLDPGANLVDVVAGAESRPSAMTALRVVRLIPVV